MKKAKNPLQLLELIGINENLTEEDVVNELSKRETELSLLQKINEEAFHSYKGSTYVSRYSIIPNSDIENMLNARFTLGLPVNRKYFTAEDFSKIIEMAKERDEARISGTSTKTSNNEAKILKNIVNDQFRCISAEKKTYQEVLKNYSRLKRLVSRGDASPELKAQFAEVNQQLEDLYIKYRFEQCVIDIASEVADGVPPVKSIDKNTDFISALKEDPRYIDFEDIYSKVKTSDKRGDLFPEIYVKRRMRDVTGLYITSQEERKNLVAKENHYISEFLDTLDKTSDEAYREGIALNRNHGYSWGIILTQPEYYMKDEDVDTPIFKGKMTVEKLGEFSEYSLFRKRKFLRETDKKTRLSAIRRIDDDTRVRKYTDTGATVREAYYAYQATVDLYDSIYRVTKTDEYGNTTENIVFSPLTYEQLRNPMYRDFIKNIYFSDYMLDIARKNSGFAGVIIDTRYGPTIQTKYSTDAIASAIVFDEGFEGSIVDARNPKERRRYNSQVKENFMKMIGGEKRINKPNPSDPGEIETSSKSKKGEKERTLGE